MDSEFLAISFVFILIGLSGITLFNGPMTPAGDSCYCIIPSPEPHAAQGTASIILALGVLFFPMGLMKGGLPSLRKGPVAKGAAAGGQVGAPGFIVSGGLFAFGVILVIVGVDVLLIPGYLVFNSLPFTGLGVVLALAGLLAVAFGLRKPKTE